jgi:hypothetical protein
MVYVVSGSMYEYDRRPFVFAHVITHSVSVPFFWRKARNSRAWPADLVVKIGTTTTRPSADRYDRIKLELVSFQFQFQSTARTYSSINSIIMHARTDRGMARAALLDPRRDRFVVVAKSGFGARARQLLGGDPRRTGPCMHARTCRMDIMRYTDRCFRVVIDQYSLVTVTVNESDTAAVLRWRLRPFADFPSGGAWSRPCARAYSFYAYKENPFLT